MVLSTYQQLVDAGVTTRELLIALLTGVDPITGSALTVSGGAVSSFDALKTGNVTERELLAALVAKQDPLTAATISGLGGGGGGAALVANQLPNIPSLVRSNAPWSAGNLVNDFSLWAFGGGGGTKTLVRAADGIHVDWLTTAAINSVISLVSADKCARSQWGSGMSCKFSVSDVTDGRAVWGYSGGNTGISTLNKVQGPMYQESGVGLCYAKDLGHTNWQWYEVGKGGTGFAATYTDTGVAIAANTPLVFTVDAPTLGDMKAEIRDATGATVLASHTFTPDTGKVPLASVDYYEQLAITTPASGTPAARALSYYANQSWRRR